MDPATVNAVSRFNSCVGHPFPMVNSPNSGKNYFWPASAYTSSTNKLRLYAACDGTLGQTGADNAPNEQDSGQTIRLTCDNSSTALRYFHLILISAALGQHVNAADFLGYASLLAPGQPPAQMWQTSSNFDIAVLEGGDDNATENYFSRLSAPAFAAWASRGLTSVAPTIVPGNPSCPSYSSNIGEPGILSLTPSL